MLNIRGGGNMKKLLEKNSSKVIAFAILLKILGLNDIAVGAVCLFMFLVDSENQNFNFGEGILIVERSIIF
jgi:hypothetical protein